MMEKGDRQLLSYIVGYVKHLIIFLLWIRSHLHIIEPSKPRLSVTLNTRDDAKIKHRKLISTCVFILLFFFIFLVSAWISISFLSNKKFQSIKCVMRNVYLCILNLLSNKSDLFCCLLFVVCTSTYKFISLTIIYAEFYSVYWVYSSFVKKNQKGKKNVENILSFFSANSFYFIFQLSYVQQTTTFFIYSFCGYIRDETNSFLLQSRLIHG